MRLGSLFFLLGILACQQLQHLPDARFTWLLFPLMVLAVLLPRFRLLMLLALGFCWTVWRADLILSQKLPVEIEGQDVTVVGTIIGLPKLNKPSSGSGSTKKERWEKEERWQFDFAPSQLVFQNQVQPPPGNLRLSWYSNPPHPLQPGQQWQLTVRLKRIHGMLNPGGLDYSSVLFQQRFRATGYVRDKSEQRLLKPPSPFNIDNWRYRLAEEIRTRLGEQPSTGIVTALAVGEERGITKEQWDTLRRTGTVHLISVSGLHISFVALLTFWLARQFWGYLGNAALWLPTFSFAAWTSLLAAFTYSLLAGFSIPTQRSFIMVAVAMSGILFARQVAGSHILALALLAVLVYDPFAVMSIGFWLSFGAVAVIVYALSGRRPQIVSRLTSWGINSGKTQWAATLGLFPALLLSFGYIPFLSSLPANTIAIPWFSVATVLTLLGALLILPWPGLSSVLFQLAAYLLDALWVSLDYLAHLPWSVLEQAIPPFWTVVVATIGVLILLSPVPWTSPAKWLGIIWLLPLFYYPLDAPNRGEIWFTLLEVGQGLAAVVRTENHLLVYDTGPKLSDNFDTGKVVVVPFLRHQGLLQIDKLLISHEDNDHSGGAQSILQELTVQEVLTSAPQLFQKYHHHVQPCQAGQHWQWDDVDFHILHPTTYYYSGKTNDFSCVLKVSTANGRSILFTGDIEATTEYHLIQHYPDDLRADILIVSHHGSHSSSTESFIDTVKPKIALFSTGYRNRFGHPHLDIVQRYRRRNISMWDTVQTGAMSFRLTANGISPPSLAREEMRRYWHE
jgi:competence protein ComEC